MSLFKVLIVLALTFPTIFVFAENDKPSSKQLKFDEFKVDEIYKGRPVFPDYEKRDKDVSNMKTRLNEAIKKGVNFAGKFHILQIGCGTGCTFTYTVDISTGQVFGFPLGGEENPYLSVEHYPNSFLVKAFWKSATKEDVSTCNVEYFEWKNNKYKKLIQQTVSKDHCNAPTWKSIGI